ncbi:MAG: hypothetical protein ACYCYK_09205 [Candidatus Dormibacteria bacterium]
MTEPLTDPQWGQINWRRRVLVSSVHLTGEYLPRTKDGRVVVDGRGAPHAFGSALKLAGEHHRASHDQLRAVFRLWFPALEDVRFTHS